MGGSSMLDEALTRNILAQGASARRQAGPPGPTVVPRPSHVPPTGSDPSQEAPPMLALADSIEVASTKMNMETASGTRAVDAVALRFGLNGQFPYPTIILPAEAVQWEHVTDMIRAVGVKAAESATAAAQAAAQSDAPPVVCSGCGSRIFGDVAKRGVCYSCSKEEE